MDDEKEPLDPWARYGWLMWSAWLVFLAFPISAALTSGAAPIWRAVCVALLLAFGGVYVAGSRFVERHDDGSSPGAVVFLGLLILVAAACLPVLGLGILGLLPFLQSFSMFALPRPWNWIAAVVSVVASLGLPILFEDLDNWWYFVFIVVAVAVGTGAGRVMSDQGKAYNRVRQTLTISAERERVARDVHDVLGHSLTVVTVKAELAERLVDVDPDRAKAELAEIRMLSRQALAEIRATVGGLRTARLDDELAGAATALAGAGIRAELPEDPRVVDPRYRPVVAWVLREAVTNVVRHSGAQRCRVELQQSCLTVSDDGRGLGHSPEGNGLRGLRERVKGTAGSFAIGPGDDGRGTRVEVRW